MERNELIKALESMLTEKIPYGDLVGAEGLYAHSGPLVYEDPESYFIEQAIGDVKELSQIKDILGDDYDISRLRELVQADRDGRCFISDVQLGDEVFYVPKYNGKSLAGIKKGHVQAVSFTKAGKRVRLREYREFNKDFMLGKTAFTTLEAAEEALKRKRYV